MVNTKSLLLLLFVASLALALFGLVRFGFDLLRYVYADGGESMHLDYGGLWVAFIFGVIGAGSFFIRRGLRD